MLKIINYNILVIVFLNPNFIILKL